MLVFIPMLARDFREDHLLMMAFDAGGELIKKVKLGNGEGDEGGRVPVVEAAKNVSRIIMYAKEIAERLIVAERQRERLKDWPQ